MNQMNDFFTPVANTQPFFKAGFQGFAGSGKTHTMALLAIELHKQIGSTKPVAMIDTEKSSRFLRPLFEAASIELVVKESRALGDLMKAMDLCEHGHADILMFDSLSHIWENYMAAYMQKVKRTRLQIQDWGIIKPAWKKEFSDRFVNSRIHAMFTGRAGYEYETETTVDENTGKSKKEMFKSGIKMKVEGETAYEPDFLVYMERFEAIMDSDKQVWREATILKDRSNTIDGKTFKNPTGATFLPALRATFTDPKPPLPRVEADDRALFDTSEEGERRKTERRITLEEIEGALVKAAPGQTAKEKAWKGDMLEKHFGTRSWTYMETRAPLEGLINGLAAMQREVAELLVVKETMEGNGLDSKPVKQSGAKPAEALAPGEAAGESIAASGEYPATKPGPNFGDPILPAA